MTSPDTILFRVDETSDLPIWAQLRNRMAYLIRTGHFQAGEQLPSVRSLAADAKINYNTVTKAYRDLELSGLIASIQDEEESAIDALLESCIRQYRSKGMTYKEVHAHVARMIDDMESKAYEAEEERQSYGTV